MDFTHKILTSDASRAMQIVKHAVVLRTQTVWSVADKEQRMSWECVCAKAVTALKQMVHVHV